jgi:putative peptide zinc metalloprotease protein
MTSLAPDWVVYTVMGTLWVAFFLPAVWVIGKPLLARVRGVGR